MFFFFFFFFLMDRLRATYGWMRFHSAGAAPLPGGYFWLQKSALSDFGFKLILGDGRPVSDHDTHFCSF